jgi:hypothetical protein
MAVASVIVALTAAGAGALPAAVARSPDAPAALAQPLGAWPAALARSAGAQSSPAAAPNVRQMVVFRDGHALAKRVSTAAASVRVSGRRCAVGERTPLAALVRSRPGPLRFRDFGACSSRARDAAGLLVTRIGPDRNRGQRGWVYKVGRRAATAGAGDTGGPFGRGRLRAGQRVLWFYCVSAGDCQRTLEVTSTQATGGIVATVRGYNDAGQGVPVEGATVTAGGVTGTTGADGRVQMALPPGTYRVVAHKDGLVRSFTERVEVP